MRYDPDDGSTWHPLWDTLRAALCLALLAMLAAELYRNADWEAVLLGVVLIGGMAS